MEQVFSYIIGLGAAVMMPVIFTVLGVCIGIRFGAALKSGLKVGVGFIGLSIVTALLTSALKDGVSANGGVAAKLTESQLGDLGEALVNANYSQKQEKAADDYGYEFLKSHGRNPYAMALSFMKLKELEQKQGYGKTSKVNQLFSSHPDLDLRIKRMSERAEKEGFTKPE